jgi:hypothetical protein
LDNTIGLYKAKVTSRDNLGGDAYHVFMRHRAIGDSRADFDCIASCTCKHYQRELRDSNRVAVVLYSYDFILTKVDSNSIIKPKPDCFLISVPTKATWQDVGNSIGVKLNPSWL